MVNDLYAKIDIGNLVSRDAGGLCPFPAQEMKADTPFFQVNLPDRHPADAPLPYAEFSCGEMEWPHDDFASLVQRTTAFFKHPGVHLSFEGVDELRHVFQRMLDGKRFFSSAVNLEPKGRLPVEEWDEIACRFNHQRLDFSPAEIDLSTVPFDDNAPFIDGRAAALEGMVIQYR